MRLLGDGPASLSAIVSPRALSASPAPMPTAAWAGDSLAGTRAGAAAEPTSTPVATDHLLCVCHDLRCAFALGDLREVLPSLPAVVPLPFSPPWLLGMFPWRTELAGLIDPAPLLLGGGAPPRDQTSMPDTGAALSATVVAGDDEHLLGLAVTRLSGVAAIAPDALHPTLAADTRLLTAPFVRGWYTAPSDGAAYAVLDLRAFMDAGLAALRDEAHDD